MKERKDLYIAENEKTGYRALVHARNHFNAIEIVKKFHKSEGNWKIARTFLNDIDNAINYIRENKNCCPFLLSEEDALTGRYILIEDTKDFLLHRNGWGLISYSVIDQDGIDFNIATIVMFAADGVNVKKSIRSACIEFCNTDEGREIFIGNNNCFNWGDFITYVPNDICKKYGLEILDNVQQENAYFDELLVTDFDIKEENE
jgi:hypothetical protein